jgi:hypothetical protein
VFACAAVEPGIEELVVRLGSMFEVEGFSPAIGMGILLVNELLSLQISCESVDEKELKEFRGSFYFPAMWRVSVAQQIR